MVTTINTVLALLTVLGGALFLIGTGAIIFRRDLFRRFPARFALPAAFIVALIATAGSLFYSEIAGYTPCELCWFQRILMYPQVILLGVALAVKDQKIMRYILWLSGIGAFIALYHYLIQLGFLPGACDVSGYSVSCSHRFVLEYGYITIPMMALTAFLLNILLSIRARLEGHSQ